MITPHWPQDRIVASGNCHSGSKARRGVKSPLRQMAFTADTCPIVSYGLPLAGTLSVITTCHAGSVLPADQRMVGVLNIRNPWPNWRNRGAA
jgi:hypothetical protein